VQKTAEEIREEAQETALLETRQYQMFIFTSLIQTGVSISPYLMRRCSMGRTTRLYNESRVTELLDRFEWGMMAAARALVITSSLKPGSRLYAMFENYCKGTLRLPSVALKNKDAWLAWARYELLNKLQTRQYEGELDIEILAGNHTNEAFKRALDDPEMRDTVPYTYQPVDLFLDIELENKHCLWLSSSENERSYMNALYGGQSCDVAGIAFRYVMTYNIFGHRQYHVHHRAPWCLNVCNGKMI
jgi:hypothetical protein